MNSMNLYQPKVNGVQLPSIRQLFNEHTDMPARMYNTSNANYQKVSCAEPWTKHAETSHINQQMKQHVETQQHHFTKYTTCTYVPQTTNTTTFNRCMSNTNLDKEIQQLENQIKQMESVVRRQAQIIENYKKENKKRKLEQVSKPKETKLVAESNKKVKKEDNGKHLTSSFTVKLNTSSNEQTIDAVGDEDDFNVIWKGETFILIDAFKNRNKIINYFIPLYQSQFPDKKCKIVLSSDEYRQLFKENSHRCQSERKHAWRISMFTMDFYNFVKNQM